MSTQPQWWGFSKEHGWVVLDREIDCNGPGTHGELLFLRCRDAKVFSLKRELWRLPAYQYAPNYVRSQTGEAAEEAAAQFESLMNRWPELQHALRSQYEEMMSAQREAERLKAEAAGASAPAKKPRRSTARAAKAVVAADEE